MGDSYNISCSTLAEHFRGLSAHLWSYLFGSLLVLWSGCPGLPTILALSPNSESAGVYVVFSCLEAIGRGNRRPHLISYCLMFNVWTTLCFVQFVQFLSYFGEEGESSPYYSIFHILYKMIKFYIKIKPHKESENTNHRREEDTCNVLD